MTRHAAKLLRSAGLLAALGITSSAPVLMGYDAATGATNTTPSPAPSTRITARIGDNAGTRAKGNFTRTVTGAKETFTGTLKIPLPNAVLGLADAATAGNAEIVLAISRQNTTYAECSLDFVGLGKNSRAAHYKLNLVSRRGLLQQKTGFCELNVTPAGPGLPKPAPRDSLTLKAVTPNGDKGFAGSVFVRK